MFGAVESGPIEVYARELGNNIPRNKVFKNYRGGDFSLRSRGDKTADMPDAAIATTSTSSAVTSSAATTVSSVAMDVITNDAQSGASDTVVCTASASFAAVVGEPASECDNTSSEASSEMSVAENENENNAVESTEVTPESKSPCSGEGTSQQPSHLQLGATLHTSKDYFLASDETVFVGTKKYSERFTFWQVQT